MFGFSVFKIIFTVVIVYVVWNAFKVFARMQDQRGDRARVNRKKPAPPPPAHGPAHGGAEDMVECATCGAYVTRGTKACGRDNCPFSG